MAKPGQLPTRPKSPSGTRWRGWEGNDKGERSVTSARLPTTAGVQSRFFPKTRSWFALGAPLELMSPLSIIRIVFAIDAVVELAGGLAWHRASAGAPLVAGAGALVVWALLLRVGSLGERESALLLAASVIDGAALLWRGSEPTATFGYVALVMPLGVVAALFLQGRLVGLVQLLGAVVVFAARLATAGPGQSLVAALLWAMGSGSVALAALLLVKTVQRQGRTDADTGLPNGFGLAQLVRQQTGWPGYIVASMLLEGIGDAREALGYRVGTELVRRAAEDIGQVLPGDALIGRVVADELVVVRRLSVPGPVEQEGVGRGIPAAAVEEAKVMATGLVRAISSGHYVAEGVEVSVRAHVGIAIAPWDGTEVEELVRRASLSAPRAASNGLVFTRWREGAGTLTAEDLALLADLRLAGERGELTLAYQPQISMRRGRTVSVEALLRWKSPGRGMVPPDRFIVLAERMGLIDRITDWVVREALDAQLRWRGLGLDIPVSVNVSAKSLTRPDLPTWILEQLIVRDLPPQALSVEITETAAPEDLAQAIDFLRPLYDHGIRISIDDFGVGYTSLSVLPRLALNEVKVDKGFVLAAPTSPTDEAIVRTLCDLARRLGLDVVAEGVETEEICRLLTDAGYDLMQGYHFARPLAESDLIAFVMAEGGVLAEGGVIAEGGAHSAPYQPTATAAP